jgi:hypothetical protein
MKTKEIKELAKKIAQAEYVLQHSDNDEKKEKAKSTILYYSNMISSIEDMLAVDDKVAKILEKLEASS